MAKKRDLQEAMTQAASRTNDGIKNKSEEATKVEKTVESTQPPSRKGKKMIGGHFDPLVARQIKVIAAENDSTIQELLTEAINDLFEKYGKKPIA
jgi:hypothetical protein